MQTSRLITFWATAFMLAQPGAVSGQPHREVDLRRTPIVEAYERAGDSVVNIAATEKVEVRRWGVDIFGDFLTVPRELSQRSVGSGVILHPDGYIATTAHVVSAASDLSVTLSDGRAYPAQVIGRETARDLAVIKIDADHSLKPIVLGRSDDLMIGENTIAVGNPVGLQNTVTTGVVSALHRELAVGGRVLYRDVIQTDASINPGNSGGPLLNIYGELIGVNTAIRTDAQNIGFAIPVDQLRELLPELLDCEKLRKLQVGMKVAGTDPPQVSEVRAGGPADRAGVRVGDVIEAVDGQRLGRSVDLYVDLLGRHAGDSVKLGLLRQGRPTEARVALTAVPRPDGKRLALTRLGVTIADVQDAAARRFRWSRGQRGSGVIVVAVEPRSPGSQADLRPGDLLVSMGSHWLMDVDHVGTLLAGVEPGDPIDIGFRRESRARLYDGEARLAAR